MQFFLLRMVCVWLSVAGNRVCVYAWRLVRCRLDGSVYVCCVWMMLVVYFVVYFVLLCRVYWIIPHLTPRIVALAETLFTWFSSGCRRCHLFWFVFSDDHRHRIHGYLTRLCRRTIHICQTGWIFFMLCFAARTLRLFGITAAVVAIWYTRCAW